jgi:hypothetical protein
MKDRTLPAINTLIVSPTFGGILNVASTGAKSPESGDIWHSTILSSANQNAVVAGQKEGPDDTENIGTKDTPEMELGRDRCPAPCEILRL